MTRQNAVHVLAGTLVLLGLALGVWVSPWWFFLCAFVGLNLFQSGFTDFCPAEKIFARFGFSDRPCKMAATGSDHPA